MTFRTEPFIWTPKYSATALTRGFEVQLPSPLFPRGTVFPNHQPLSIAPNATIQSTTPATAYTFHHREQLCHRDSPRPCC